MTKPNNDGALEAYHKYCATQEMRTISKADWLRAWNLATQAAYERAAMLHESVNPASDGERSNNDPGAGAMGAVIEYRDLIRNLAKGE